MVKLLGSALLVGGLAFLATPASAQKKSATSAPMGGFHHELGVDFAADYAKPSGVSGGIEMGLPVDIRIAFVSANVGRNQTFTVICIKLRYLLQRNKTMLLAISQRLCMVYR